jgi:WD40 repeat protein
VEPRTNVRTQDVCFSPSGDRIAWTEFDGTIRIWDFEQGGLCPAPDDQSTAGEKAICFWRDADHLIYCGQYRVPKLWSIAERKITSIDPALINVGKVAVSCDGRWLATVQDGTSVTLFDLDAKRILATLPSEGSVILQAAWSPQGERLALGLADGGVVIWDVAEIKSQLDELGLGWTTSGGIKLKKTVPSNRD